MEDIHNLTQQPVRQDGQRLAALAVRPCGITAFPCGSTRSLSLTHSLCLSLSLALFASVSRSLCLSLSLPNRGRTVWLQHIEIPVSSKAQFALMDVDTVSNGTAFVLVLH